jgi:transketolase
MPKMRSLSRIGAAQGRDQAIGRRSRDFTWAGAAMWALRAMSSASIAFGASAPGGLVMEKFGFTVDNVVSRAKALLG